MQLRGDIPLRGETLDPLVAVWHDDGLLGISLRGETLDPLVIEWHDGGLSEMPLRRETVDPQVTLSSIVVDSQR